MLIYYVAIQQRDLLEIDSYPVEPSTKNHKKTTVQKINMNVQSVQIPNF